VPLSSFATIDYSSTYASIKRKNQKRCITVYSNVLGGFAPNEVVASVQQAVADYELPEGVTVDMTGEQEQQAETTSFLGSDHAHILRNHIPDIGNAIQLVEQTADHIE